MPSESRVRQRANAARAVVVGWKARLPPAADVVRGETSARTLVPSLTRPAHDGRPGPCRDERDPPCASAGRANLPHGEARHGAGALIKPYTASRTIRILIP